MQNGRLNGKAIADRLKERGVTYAALAADLGISPSSAHHLSKGYLPLKHRDEILSRLAKWMGCSVAALFTPETGKRPA